ncbi:MAG: hypothetical protein NC177_18030, partial [Ruminococcus flavefaciens]|nr:hypothetical protein [Ruminococcus flavefaciens]
MSVIRSDIVEIGFKVKNDPTEKINSNLDGMQSRISTVTDSFENGFDGVKDTVSKAADGVEELKTQADKLSQTGADGLSSDLQDTVENAHKSADSIQRLSDNLTHTGSTASKVTEEINSSATAAQTFAAKLRDATAVRLTGINNDIASFDSRTSRTKEHVKQFFSAIKPSALRQFGSEKLEGLTNGIKQIKTSFSQVNDRLKEGKKGIKGFITASKNIGKIGVEKLVSRFDKLKDKFTGGEKGAKGLLKAVKKIGKEPMQKAISGMSKFGKTAGSAAKQVGLIAAKIGKIGVKGLMKGLAGVGAAAAAVGAIVAKSVTAYSDYEQLIGGVETLFKGSASVVEKNANDAYKTAGLSANEYMETVTSFSASLLQSLKGDTQKSASVADRAITDMADNANKMGSSMESIQNAYQGFAKQNYTMLDNLKLGYGGTKSEMERLLKDAGKLEGKKFNLSSYADIIEAIHAIQKNMDITGTTAKEAEHTIQGSLASMKSSWNNLLTSMAVGGDSLDQCIDNLVSSVKTFGKNVIPVAKKALGGVGTLINELAPEIAKEIPSLVESLLPPLLKSATSIINGLVSALPNLLNSIIKVFPDVLDGLLGGLVSLVDGLLKVLGESGPEIILTLVNGLSNALTSLIEIYPSFVTVGLQLISALIQGVAQALPTLIPTIVNSIAENFNNFFKLIPQLIQVGLQLVMGLVQGIFNALPVLAQQAPVLIQNLVTAIEQSLPIIIESGIQLIDQLINGIISNLPAIIDAALLMVNALLDGIMNNLPTIINGAFQLVNALVVGLIQCLPMLLESTGTLLDGLWNAFTSIDWIELGKTIITSIWEGIKGLGSSLWSGIKGIFGGKGNDADISSNGKAAGNSFASGIESGISSAVNKVDENKSKITSSFDNIDLSVQGVNAIQSFESGINTQAASLATEGIGNTLTSSFSSINLTDAGAASMNSYSAGLNSSSEGVISTAQTVSESVKSATDLDLTPQGVKSVQTLSDGMNSTKPQLDSVNK